MAIEVRYPGRVCALGEHNDWAGGASLTLPLPMGIRVQAEETPGSFQVEASLDGEWLVGSFPPGGVVLPQGGALRFAAAAPAVLAERGLAPSGARLVIHSDLPAGRGFSSSAAVSLACLDALARLAGHRLGADELAGLATELERDRLGIPCGMLDPLACAWAQPLFLRWLPQRNGPPAVAVRPLQPGTRFHLVLACLPRPRDTAGILTSLRAAFEGDLRDALQAERARAAGTALAAWGALATTGARALLAGDAPTLGRCMNEAWEIYLYELSESVPALAVPGLRPLVTELRRCGALGAKWSGAGGDGSLIALMDGPDTGQAAVDLLRSRGLWATACVVGEE